MTVALELHITHHVRKEADKKKAPAWTVVARIANVVRSQRNGTHHFEASQHFDLQPFACSKTTCHPTSILVRHEASGLSTKLKVHALLVQKPRQNGVQQKPPLGRQRR